MCWYTYIWGVGNERMLGCEVRFRESKINPHDSTDLEIEITQ